MKPKNKFPPGWDERRVRAVLEYYENQTEEEALIEHEAALSRPDHTLIPIPSALVPKVHQLLAEHESKQRS